MTTADAVSELIAFMKKEGINVVIKGKTIYDEAPKFMKYLEQNYGELKIERLKGNSCEGAVGVMCNEYEKSEHAYEILSGVGPIGCYSFSLELFDGDILNKSFEFYNDGKKLLWEPGKGRLDKHKHIPFP
ncbi:MAG: hypothetical protein NT129_02210 [Candidatus Aenigmarchaeota archaeon]|nr:hypothetical protein [Candidatus Aenigmarchaeota archaeon]